MTLRIALAQINLLVGDIDGNADRILAAARRARHELGARLVVFPELALTGYPPEDLLLRPSLLPRLAAACARLQQFSAEEAIVLVVGAPVAADGTAALANGALVFAGGRETGRYAKQHLPNYRVFDEHRYFVPGNAPLVFELDGVRIGLAVCEDVWFPGPAAQAKAAGAQCLLALNASPFHAGKQTEREIVLRSRVHETGLPVAYVNLVGGQDELVFDGGSCVLNAAGDVVARAPHAVETLLAVDWQHGDFRPGDRAPVPGEEQSIYDALVLGVRDYIDKNGFRGALLGLSGGIDSALTAAIAVDALGADRVEAVMMPFRYTAQMSIDDAREEADILGVRFRIIPIEGMFDAFMSGLQDAFAGTARDATEENLQARCRGVLLMAMSNKQRYLVLTTGNKSEMAVGYATLYGDMAGGFDVLKDVLKTMVYRLSEYRNALAVSRGETPPVPRRVIERAPSAELAPDQKDSDSLPDYPVLDAILRLYVEDDLSAEQVIAQGHDKDTVYRVVRMVDRNEYKRRQAATGPRVTRRGFGKDRRYPITNGWQPGI
ncbi:MAG: NAD+ synthase [Pseudomonadota bacterium]